MQRLSSLKEEVERWRSIQMRISDALELAEMSDSSLLDEMNTETNAISALVDDLSFKALMSGKFDKEDAILSIYAGAGGTESQDWVSMLLRMFLRWAEDHHMKSEILDQMDGEEAGIKSVTLTIKGAYAYGYLQSERGVHRLVRISPFDAAKRRHTSFSLVEVYPDIHNDIDIEIPEKDITVEFVPVKRRRRPERPKERNRDPRHTPADWDRRHLPERAQPDAKPGKRHERLARAFVRL